MSFLPLVDPTAATGPVRDLLTAVDQYFGMTPNVAKAMANSPALLQGWLRLNQAVDGGTLPEGLRRKVALAVSQANKSSYCVSAVSFIAANITHLSADEVETAREARSDDRLVDAALKFAVALVKYRGRSSEAELQACRTAGMTDEQIAEIIAVTGLYTLNNIFNNAVDPDLEFPAVPLHDHVPA